jgi:hypothetical protein
VILGGTRRVVKVRVICRLDELAEASQRLLEGRNSPSLVILLHESDCRGVHVDDTR